jgi:hypothetical protein
MASERLLREMVSRIHSFPQLRGCVIGFYGDGQCRLLNAGFSATPNSARVAVIIEECVLSDGAVLEETRRWAGAPAGSPENAPNPTIVTNRSRIGRELAGAGLSCTLTVVSALGVVGGAAAEVPSAGTSTFLIVAGWVGFLSQGVQCINGMVRIGEIIANPDDNSLDLWDHNRGYQVANFIVDAVGIASGIASLPAATRNLWAILARQRSFVARGLTLEGLKRMNQAERLRVIGDLVEEAYRTPQSRAALIAAAREAGVGARSIQRTTGLSVRHANTMVRIISEKTIRRLHSTLLEVFGNLAGIGVSATPESWTGSGSGSVNTLINLIDLGAPAGRTSG